jgi:hypothetical protein
MLAKNTGGWGADFIGEQSKYSVILNGVSSSAGIPACVLFSAGRAQERSSPSKLSRSLFFSPSSAREATTVTSATKTDLQTVAEKEDLPARTAKVLIQWLASPVVVADLLCRANVKEPWARFVLQRPVSLCS